MIDVNSRSPASPSPDPTALSLPSEDELRPEVDPETGIDLSLLDENLKLSPWERIMANVDVVNFGGALKSAMKR